MGHQLAFGVALLDFLSNPVLGGAVSYLFAFGVLVLYATALKEWPLSVALERVHRDPR